MYVNEFVVAPPVSLMTLFQMYHILRVLLGDNFSQDDWTSTLRTKLDFEPFEGTALADFTVKDHHGTLTNLWFGADWLLSWPDAQGWPTYHIEVKTTSNGFTQPFHLSSSQLQTVRTMFFPLEIFYLSRCIQAIALDTQSLTNKAPDHVYAIAHVAHIRNKPTFKVYLNPIRGIRHGHLQVSSDVFISGQE